MKRLLISVVLIFFIFSTSSIVYTEVKGSTDPFLEDSSDFYLTSQKLQSKNNSTLVPTGVIQGVNDVYFIEYQYELLIKEGTDLHSSVKNLAFNNADLDNETIEQLFNFEFSYEVVETINYHEDLFGAGVDADRIIVTLIITMNEPNSYELFEIIAGNQLSFESYFFVA